MHYSALQSLAAELAAYLEHVATISSWETQPLWQAMIQLHFGTERQTMIAGHYKTVRIVYNLFVRT